MGILEIILFGIALNFVLLGIFVVLFTASILLSMIRGNFELMFWLEKVNIQAKGLIGLRKTKPFLIRHHNTITKLIPFSGLYITTVLIYNIVRFGFVETVEKEIKKEEAYLKDYK